MGKHNKSAKRKPQNKKNDLSKTRNKGTIAEETQSSRPRQTERKNEGKEAPIERGVLRVTFESDWHIGSGAGIPGSVDQQILRDDDGLPYIPGKTLTGILRDAAEWVADTRDAAENGELWHKAVLTLFGEQPQSHGGTGAAQGAVLGIEDARFPPGVRDYIKKRKTLLPDLVITQPGVTIDPRTGRALKDHLFSVEKARKGCVLDANFHFFKERISDDEERTRCEKLLKDALSAVRRIGGNRRRGAGKCQMERVSVEFPQEDSKSVELAYKDIGDEDFANLDFRLTTLQPVIVNRATHGNVVESETTIPGSLLLPYLANECLKNLDESAKRDAIMSGDFSVGNFLPEFDGKPSYPVPLSFGKKKESGEILNRLIGSEREEQVKDLRSGFVTFDDKCIHYHPFSDSKILRTHNTVEDKSQRPTEKVGGLFFYEAIREGQIFRGTVKIKGTVWKKIWGEIPKDGSVGKKLFKNEISIGRSRKDEYGRVCLEAIPTAREVAQNFDIQKTDGKSYLVVYFLSDVLIRGDFQEYSTRIDDLRAILGKALGLELSDIPAEEWSEGLSPLKGERGHCVRIGRRESWHTRWTLPRPSLLYFQAGSILLFKIEDPTNWKKDIILKVMNEGIGERRAEGYGRVWIDPPFLREERGINVPEDAQGGDTADAAVPVSDEVQKFIALLETAYFRRVFARNARREIYTLISSQNNEREIFNAIPWGKNIPSASQFGALREAAALGEGKECLEHIERLLKMDLQTNSEQKNISHWSDDWRKWLKGVISNRQCIKKWNIVSEEIWDRAKTSMGFSNNEADKELGTFALPIFIDILCEAIFDRQKHGKRQRIDKEGKRDEPRAEGEN